MQSLNLHSSVFPHLGDLNLHCNCLPHTQARWIIIIFSISETPLIQARFAHELSTLQRTANAAATQTDWEQGHPQAALLSLSSASRPTRDVYLNWRWSYKILIFLCFSWKWKQQLPTKKDELVLETDSNRQTALQQLARLGMLFFFFRNCIFFSSLFFSLARRSPPPPPPPPPPVAAAVVVVVVPCSETLVAARTQQRILLLGIERIRQ